MNWDVLKKGGRIRKDPGGIGRELGWLTKGAAHLLMDHLTSLKHSGGILTKQSDGSSESVSGLTHGLVIPKSILVVESKLVKLVLTSHVVVALEDAQTLALGNVVGNVGTRAVITLESTLGFQHSKVSRTKHPAHRRHSDGSVGGSNTDFLGARHDVFFIPFLVVCRRCCWCFEERFVSSSGFPGNGFESWKETFEEPRCFRLAFPLYHWRVAESSSEVVSLHTFGGCCRIRSLGSEPDQHRIPSSETPCQ